MDRLMELKRGGRRRPRLRPGADRARAARAARERPGRRGGRRCRPARPRSSSTTRCFVPPFLGSRVVKGISLDDIAEYVNETALFRNQWQFRPEAGESDDEFKARIRPMLREQLAAAKASGRARAPGRLRLLPGQRRRRRPRRVDRRDAQRPSGAASASRASGSSRTCASPTSSGRSSSGEADYAAFHIVTMGGAVSEATAELFAENRYQEYLLLHGLGVEMAEALAELWHRRIREEWGFADEDGPTLGRAVPPAVPRRALLLGLPGLPRPRGQRHGGRAARRPSGSASRSSEETGWQYQPEQTTSAIICHHPRAKYFVAR